MSGEFLTTREVEQLMQLNRVTIYRLIREESFPAVKLGGQWRFPKQRVLEWLDAHHLAATTVTPTNEPVPFPVDEAAKLTDDPYPLFHSLEITALLDAFASSINLTVSVIDNDGAILVDYPSCRHPFCQYVREHNSELCLLTQRQNLQACTVAKDTPNVLECESGLRYLEAPIRFQGEVVAHVLMGPIVMEQSENRDVAETLDAFAQSTGSDARILRQYYDSVQQFSMDQVRILVNLFSQVMSTMLQVVSGQLRAMERLGEIAQLATHSPH